MTKKTTEEMVLAIIACHLELNIAYCAPDRYFGPKAPWINEVVPLKRGKDSFRQEYVFGKSPYEPRVPSGAGYRMW